MPSVKRRSEFSSLSELKTFVDENPGYVSVVDSLPANPNAVVAMYDYYKASWALMMDVLISYAVGNDTPLSSTIETTFRAVFGVNLPAKYHKNGLLSSRNEKPGEPFFGERMKLLNNLKNLFTLADLALARSADAPPEVKGAEDLTDLTNSSGAIENPLGDITGMQDDERKHDKEEDELTPTDDSPKRKAGEEEPGDDIVASGAVVAGAGKRGRSTHWRKAIMQPIQSMAFTELGFINPSLEMFRGQSMQTLAVQQGDLVFKDPAKSTSHVVAVGSPGQFMGIALASRAPNFPGDKFTFPVALGGALSTLNRTNHTVAPFETLEASAVLRQTEILSGIERTVGAMREDSGKGSILALGWSPFGEQLDVIVYY